MCRKVEPIGLCNYSSRWHLFAWCQLRKDYRDFRLDRILSLRPTDEYFKGKQHPSIKEYMQMTNPISNVPNISVLVPKKRVKLIEDSKYWYGFLSEEEAGENVSMQFSNDELNGFAVWLLNTGSHAKVQEPAELKQIIQSYVKEMVENYRELL
jgi:predicted DNA-binding transcriptional regulator YafY